MSRRCLPGLNCTKLLGLNKYKFAVPIFSENILKTQGQFKNAILETVFLNKSCRGRRNLRTLNTICCRPYWISIHECIISASGKLGKSSH